MAKEASANDSAKSDGPSFISRKFTDPSERYSQKWHIGDISVTKIIEMEFASDLSSVIPRSTREDLKQLPWLQPHFANARGLGWMSIHALIIQTPTHRIIVDTCVGAEKNLAPWRSLHNLQNLPFLNDLTSCGFPRESFDAVLCTHLHIDHVGWNTILVDGKWVPTFPNARYLFGKIEYEYWKKGTDINVNHWDEIQRLAFSDSVQPVFDAGLVDLIDVNHKICDGINLVPTIGHSPGHVSVHIMSQGEEAFITGDIAHHPCQMAHLDWSAYNDSDPDKATETRKTVFGELAGKPVLVIGTHWAGATAGHVVQDGQVYRLKV